MSSRGIQNAFSTASAPRTVGRGPALRWIRKAWVITRPRAVRPDASNTWLPHDHHVAGLDDDRVGGDEGGRVGLLLRQPAVAAFGSVLSKVGFHAEGPDGMCMDIGFLAGNCTFGDAAATSALRMAGVVPAVFCSQGLPLESAFARDRFSTS